MDDLELLDTSAHDAATTTYELSRRAIPRWLAVIPVVLIAIGALSLSTAKGDESGAPLVSQPAPSSTTDSIIEDSEAGSSFGQRRIRGNEAERLGLIHGSQPYARSGGTEGDHVIALRSGSDLVVMDSTKQLAHRIQLPLSSSNDEVAGFTMAVVADKLIVADGDLLRSLSVQGGVDILLANDLVGFQVDANRLIVAAETVDARFRNRRRTELRIQGVHADFFGVPGESPVPDGARIVATGGQVFVELGGQVLVPTSGGLQVLHPGSVIAAGSNHAFVRSCALAGDDFDCAAFRVSLDGSEVLEISDPPFFGESQYAVSPLGDEVFIINDGTGTQGLVQIGNDGVWSETMELESSEISAATFTEDGSILVTVSGGVVNFWRARALIGSWTISDLGEVSEIAIAR